MLRQPKKSIMMLRQFQAKVAKGLIEVGMARKRGRPSIDERLSPVPAKMIRVNPSLDARYDQLAHWPGKADKRRRCAVCKLKSDVIVKNAPCRCASMSNGTVTELTM